MEPGCCWAWSMLCCRFNSSSIVTCQEKRTKPESDALRRRRRGVGDGSSRDAHPRAAQRSDDLSRAVEGRRCHRLRLRASSARRPRPGLLLPAPVSSAGGLPSDGSGLRRRRRLGELLRRAAERVRPRGHGVGEGAALRLGALPPEPVAADLVGFGRRVLHVLELAPAPLGARPPLEEPETGVDDCGDGVRSPSAHSFAHSSDVVKERATTSPQ